MNSTWLQALEVKKIKEKNLDEIIQLIEEEGRLRMPRHQRRLQLLKAKRNAGKHSDFLFTLETLMGVSEFDSMTPDEMVLHLFAEHADNTMSKIALDILAKTKPTVDELRHQVAVTENAIWYKQKDGFQGKVAYSGERFCVDCKSKSHSTQECWGLCDTCGRRGHKSQNCRQNPNRSGDGGQGPPAPPRAQSAQEKKKKKKKKKKAKTAADKPQDGQTGQSETENNEESESELSEEESPTKPLVNSRAQRVNLPPEGGAKRALFKPDLNTQLSNMTEDEAEIWGEGVFKALRAKAAKTEDNPVVMATAWSKLNSGISTRTDAVMDSGCTHPVVSLSVVKALKMQVQPLSNELTIIEASGSQLKIEGTVRIYLEAEVLGGRKLLEAAVLRGETEAKEILVSLGYLKKWDLLHDSFPMESVSSYINRISNKGYSAYSSLYSFHSKCEGDNHHSESKPLKEPSKKCRKMKEEIVKNWSDCFKDKLEKGDRMKVAPVKLTLKDSNEVKPSFHTRPYDTPFHLRDAYERELNDALEAGQLEPCGTEPSEWSSKAFPVPKGDGKSVRIVADFKHLNKQLLRPCWPTESATQLIRHIDPEARYFVSCDMTSGYHQIALDEESSKLLVITTPMGRFRYKVLAQGVCSSSDIFNFLTDGNIRHNSSGALKNMDDILLHGRTLEEVKAKLENFLGFCRDKNLKLKPSKLNISESVEFGGAVISSETVRNEQVVSILPKDKRIQAFHQLKKPGNKKEIQVFCGMLSSLQAWH